MFYFLATFKSQLTIQEKIDLIFFVKYWENKKKNAGAITTSYLPAKSSPLDMSSATFLRTTPASPSS